jgi:hypothetical protein
MAWEEQKKKIGQLHRELAKKAENKKVLVDFLTQQGWRQFTSGFIVGGFGGASIAYVLLKFVV